MTGAPKVPVVEDAKVILSVVAVEEAVKYSHLLAAEAELPHHPNRRLLNRPAGEHVAAQVHVAD